MSSFVSFSFLPTYIRVGFFIHVCRTFFGGVWMEFGVYLRWEAGFIGERAIVDCASS
jgi:hypothetical protein